MEETAPRGTMVPNPPDAGKRNGARPGWDGGRYAFTRRVLETETGRALYGKRQEMTEPIFANAKFNHRIDASYAAAEPPVGPNGASSPPPATSSSSTPQRRPPN